MTHLDNKQQLFCAISGYEPIKPHSSAKDDFYYTLTTKEEKLKQLDNYGFNILNEGYSTEDLEKVYEALEKNSKCETAAERFAIYDSLVD